MSAHASPRGQRPTPRFFECLACSEVALDVRSAWVMTRNRSITFLAGAAVLVLAAVAVAGCGGGGSKATGPPKTASGKTATVGVSNASLGNIVVNSQGRTLYLFKRDSG